MCAVLTQHSSSTDTSRTRVPVQPSVFQAVLACHIENSGLEGNELVHEALLDRGFLSFRDKAGLWLGTGSHPKDIGVLELIDGMNISAVTVDNDRVCRIGVDPKIARDVANEIVHLGQHDGSFTTFGPGPFLASDWDTYRKMKWGAKLPVCPASSRFQNPVPNALDTGVALLVKALPLARVATSESCDGHGKGPAWVSFHFPWDAMWLKAVMEALDVPHPNSEWVIRNDGLKVKPLFGYSDHGLRGMFNDIQAFSRRLMSQDVIDWLGRTRYALINKFPYEPDLQVFYRLAHRELFIEAISIQETT